MKNILNILILSIILIVGVTACNQKKECCKDKGKCEEKKECCANPCCDKCEGKCTEENKCCEKCQPNAKGDCCAKTDSTSTSSVKSENKSCCSDEKVACCDKCDGKCTKENKCCDKCDA